MVSWATLECQVREIAEAHWNSSCEPRYVDGVKCDGVIELSDDHWIAIEISEEKSLAKLRTDLAKFASIRPAQMARGVLVKCYFVTNGDTSSLKDTGRAQKVEVLSVAEFSEKFVGRSNYNYVRGLEISVAPLILILERKMRHSSQVFRINPFLVSKSTAF